MIDGGLFTRDFLLEGIVATPQWAALEESDLVRVQSIARTLFNKITTIKNPSEPVTEKDLIYPLLKAIGWEDRVFVQPNASVKGRFDVPDALLFADDAAHDRARKEPDDWKRFQHGLCVVEAKKWNRILDRLEKRASAEEGVPSTQMLRYLRRVDDVTKGGVRWGVLTNGRVWRLYWQGALSVAEDFLEIDLGKVFDLPGCDLDLLDKKPEVFSDNREWREHALKLFVLLFGPAAFLASDGGSTFHDYALTEGKFWEARVAKTLSDKVFDEVFPSLADALTKADPARKSQLTAEYLEEVRQGTLILLYRLLFVLYAEDRSLLPDESGAYADYCLTRIRLEIAERKAAGRTFPTSFATYWPKLSAIFRAVAEGNDDLGIPPYNGGLFDRSAAPILERTQISDAVVADAIFGLSHEKDDGSGRGPKYINYRDLSVQQLGSVYERILEFGLRATSSGGVEIDSDDEARHKSGSYYTPEDLVSLIIERAVGPLVEERIAIFKARSDALASDRRSIAARLAELSNADPAIGILALKVCDPAMGSGHFLVSLVDWLADEVLRAMAEATSIVSWGTYISPLTDRISAVREKILSEAKKHRWPIVPNQLDDRHVVRRMVLKRVVYGVDKNPMAVELAKVALWLHSFTVGAPLSFLDHHLRSGDSVIGAWVQPTVAALSERGALFNMGPISRVEQVAGLMAEIEETTDNDIVEVAASKAKFNTVADATEPLAALFSLVTAERMLGVFDASPRRAPDLRVIQDKSEKRLAKAQADLSAFDRAAALQLILEGTFGDPIRIASGVDKVAPDELVQQLALLPEGTLDPQSNMFPSISVDDRRRVIANGLVEESLALEHRHHFFHWEIGFPNVWSKLVSKEPEGGFDAVIGNPPYVRQELLGDDVKRALKKAYSTFDGMADLYVYFYEQGLKLLKPGGRMSYVVTNKWLRTNYAESVRDLFATRGWLEFITDFGHAKHLFPDADVLPSVIVVRKPSPNIAPPLNAEVCVIPRDEVPRKGLSAAVQQATFALPRDLFTKESWVLEPKPVMDLLAKLRRNGVPLGEYNGVKTYRGILTGLNEAFLINQTTRDDLIREDPKCAEIVKPYLRGQDIERWWSPNSNLFMIAIASSSDHAWPWTTAVDETQAQSIFAATYPSLHRHLKRLEPSLRKRLDQGRYWWELRSCSYYKEFDRPKIVYQAIQYSPRYSIETKGLYGNNKTYFITTTAAPVIAALNSPIIWWLAWRQFAHMKDEALSNDAVKIVEFPMPVPNEKLDASTDKLVSKLVRKTQTSSEADRVIVDWLKYEFALEKSGTILAAAHSLDADSFVSAVRKALPKSKKLSASDIGRLKQEHLKVVEPARLDFIEALGLERELSDLVNTAYGLTAAEVSLMWATAPPRMPFKPPTN